MDMGPDFTPAQLWRYVVGPYVSPLRITPRSTLKAILRGHLQKESINIMISVAETAKAINRITDRNELAGAKP